MSEQEYAHIMEEQDINNARQKEESISALELFESGLTKTDIKVMANAAVESVLNQGNVLQVAEALAAMIEFVDTIKKDNRFKEYVREETTKTPKGYVAPSGARIEVAEVGTKYDFTKCEDKELDRLIAEGEILETEIKNRKDFLKTIPQSGKDELYPDGEVIRIYPPFKTSISSYKITLAK